MCRQNRLINDQEVNTLRNMASWRSRGSPESPKSHFDAPPPNTTPGHLIYLKDAAAIPANALIRQQLADGGMGHPMLIIHEEPDKGIMHCLLLTSFGHSKRLSPAAQRNAANFRRITHADDTTCARDNNDVHGGTPLTTNYQLDKHCWVDQSTVYRVTVDCTKKYVNGMHCLDSASLRTIQDHCAARLRNSARSTSAEGWRPEHRRARSAPEAKREGRRDVLALDNWRARAE